ncbi:MAG: diguanylate cyclase [Pseudomonadota bacterium]
MAAPDHSACLDHAALDRLMPLHLDVGPDGVIRHVGPTLAKVAGGAALERAAFFDHFELRRPKGLTNIAALTDTPPRALRLRLTAPREVAFTGVATRLTDGGALINLSFGIGVVDVVRDHDLTSTDFAPTDLTVEMLYLREAQTAAMDEWRKLSERLAGARDAAEERAFTDPLTGLNNRRTIDKVAAELIGAREAFSLMLVDLDYFKQVNDALGHPAGDDVLRTVATVLREETRRNDVVCRVGGDEFAVLMTGVCETTLAKEIAGRILLRLEEEITVAGGMARVSASIGITASCLYPVARIEDMMRDADMALYRSKNAGRSQYTFVTKDQVDRRGQDTVF